MWLWLAVFGVALGKAELVVYADAPVVVFVNLRPFPHKGGAEPITVAIDDGKAGKQRVAIRNALSELVWAGDVEVQDEQRVTIRYSRKSVLVEDIEELQGRRKLGSQGIHLVDGEWTYGSPGRPPKADSGELLPEPAPTEDVYLDAVAEAGAEGASAGGDAGPTDAIVRPGPGGRGQLRLANRSTSWANVAIGGEVHLFRGERSKDLELESGPHVVQIRDFKDAVLYQGTLWVWPDALVELQFSPTAAPAVPERPEAWILQPPPEAVVP